MEDDLSTDYHPAGEIVDGIRVTIHAVIAEIVLDRVAVHNALNLAMWRQLRLVFQELSGRSALRAIILRGAGSRAFSAGADIGEFRHLRYGPSAAAYNAAVASALEVIRDIPLPVIAMVNGLAVGGGCEILTVCDVRVAGEHARFGIPVTRLGVPLGQVEAAALVGAVGAAHAKDLLLTGRLIDAAEALRMGLVQRVVPDADLEAVTWELAEQITWGAPLAAAVNKLVVNTATFGPRPDVEEQVRILNHQIFWGSDLLEGLAAFEQRREPLFRGIEQGDGERWER